MTDDSLRRLLDLDGEIMDMGGGHWVKIVAREVPPTPERPHGINYSLCLFSPNDERLVWFDNAHAVPTGRGRWRRRSAANDHRHRGSRVESYGYTDAETLMTDFWTEVDRVLKDRGVP